MGARDRHEYVGLHRFADAGEYLHGKSRALALRPAQYGIFTFREPHLARPPLSCDSFP